MRKFSVFYLFLLLAVSYAVLMIWLSDRSSAAVGLSVGQTPADNYESISVRADTFAAMLQKHLNRQHARTAVPLKRTATQLNLSYPGGNIFMNFNIIDTANFYKRWSNYVRYDASVSTLKMEFPIRDESMDVPAALVLAIYKQQ
jgi:hypothetical protein